MNRSLVIATALAVTAALAGWRFMDKPFRLEAPGQPADQAALDHRDSAYSSITWVASEAENYLQLRFFDRVEGGVCLKPSWADLVTLARTRPSLAHLVPEDGVSHAPAPGPTWSRPWIPDPGTLSNSAYVRLFPAGVLLNERLMAAAKGDARAAAPRIMVVGLGSGIGLATLAHHFPNAAITVVDIDATVIAMVRAHYPLLDWLATRTRADGQPRLRFIARDARQFIRYDATRESPYDLVILDAYTSGSTIPPHLMTREFFAEISRIIGDDGLTLANIIGNVSNGADGHGDKSLVLGGAIRSFRAAGLTNAWCFPILSAGDSAGALDASRQRNNIVITSKRPIDPRQAAAGWERLKTFELLPELPIGAYTTSLYLLADTRRNAFVSASLPATALDAIDPGLRNLLTTRQQAADAIQQPALAMANERSVVERAMRAARTLAERDHLPLPLGWNGSEAADMIQRRDTDWVLAARETLHASVAAARDANKWSGEALTGDIEQNERPPVKEATWLIPDAPLFTDQRPNADIYNH